jgi:hypothetical protein
MTHLETLRGLIRDLAGNQLDCYTAIDAASSLGADIFLAAIRARKEWEEQNPVAHAWACVVHEPTFTDNEVHEAILSACLEIEANRAGIPTETPEEAEFLDGIENSHVHACFAPALDMVRPPKGMAS